MWYILSSGLAKRSVILLVIRYKKYMLHAINVNWNLYDNMAMIMMFDGLIIRRMFGKMDTEITTALMVAASIFHKKIFIQAIYVFSWPGHLCLCCESFRPHSIRTGGRWEWIVVNFIYNIKLSRKLCFLLIESSVAELGELRHVRLSLGHTVLFNCSSFQWIC